MSPLKVFCLPECALAYFSATLRPRHGVAPVDLWAHFSATRWPFVLFGGSSAAWCQLRSFQELSRSSFEAPQEVLTSFTGAPRQSFPGQRIGASQQLGRSTLILLTCSLRYACRKLSCFLPAPQEFLMSSRGAPHLLLMGASF